MPTKVLASRFNTLKARVDKILGFCVTTNPSSGLFTFGYGQSIGSGTNVVAGSPNTIDASDYKLLYINILKIRYHQVGTAAFSAEAFRVGNYAANAASTDKVEEAYMSGLETLATNMETDKFLVHTSQSDLASCDASISASNWNGSLSHIFTVTFNDAQHRREFFNAGGLIRFIPAMDYSGSQAKSLDWKASVNSIGTVSFGCQGTSVSSGLGQAYGGIGHDYMNSSYQTAYYKAGGGVYNPNRYTVYAMELSSSVLQFKCEFSDPSYGQPDENVFGPVSNSAFFVTPNGVAQIDGTTTVTVQQLQPTSSTISTL